MKILHINQSDIGGGAAIAASRLHQGLLARGKSSKLLVGEALTSDPNVEVIDQNINLNKQLFRLNGRFGLLYINILSTFDIPKHPFYQEADILNLHNLHGSNGWFNYLALGQLTKSKPAILTLHDMWSFTGHCAYSYDCDRWKIGCGKCPYPDRYPHIYADNTKLEWKLKDWVYNHANLTIVAPSQWLAAEARASMLGRYDVYCIPNGIDTEDYKPIETPECRQALGLPLDKKIIMFGATDLNDARKGGDLLLKSLQNLPESIKSETILLTFGSGGEEIAQQVGMKVVNLGYLNNDREKSIAYSAADLFIFPTRADNLPLVLQESIACGTPMVSFKIGGVPDLVRPGVTGYLAEPEDPIDLCNGIVELLKDDRLRQVMSVNCREIALAEYALHLQAQRYAELYQTILQQS
ncbi:glycosyltransferase family 4 protein [Chamaesiphon polymorphus]|uniref:Glycosyl transferase n=1 Tax=Chamaesiphon polymorphus CCALA 037 TaxID=2107692 RepID=A0A2T1GMB3_9CYAN|nr:glycosyltransferase family 4 protein [Chamaesiphon polymorphus]PSB59042.1 glycosyl transferase [Chamaesiphon polymorphus CCALA 037]